MINAVMYSYKNKDIQAIVDHLFSVSEEGLHLTLIDQYQLDRSAKFAEYKNFDYKHVFWDKINSPSMRKCNVIFNPDISSDYTMVLSDDIMLEVGWEDASKKFLSKNPNSIISGFGGGKIKIAEKYLFEKEEVASLDFTSTNYVDSKFIFAKTLVMKNIDYPSELKYRGESERLSLLAHLGNIDVFSAPSTMLKEDRKKRYIENLYTPFAIEHNYNQTISEVVEKFPEFFTDSDIDLNQIRPIPYQVDDVLYDPYDMEMLNVNQERFIARVKAIY